jgi:glycerol-3-phosphate O-acyltransferase / dihydroxyacetone phosphate acyltransferase
VPTLEQDDYLKLFYTIAHALLVFTLATMPTLVLNAPVGVIARIFSSREQKKALAASRVKIEARDVVMSKKITLSIVLVPTLWVTYAVLLLKYTRLQPATVLVLFLCCPLFSYIGVMATEAGMVDFKDLKVRGLPACQPIQVKSSRVPQYSLARSLARSLACWGGAVHG